MRAWIRRHKVITALIITFVVVPVPIGILNSLGVSIDLGVTMELMGIGWFIYGFAWLTRKRHRAKTTSEEPKE